MVVKADAYSHGALMVAKACENDADEFAVATLKEAAELVVGGITKPINILGTLGGLDYEYDSTAILLDFMRKNSTVCDIMPVICCENDIFNPLFKHLNLKKVNIKVDTGMNRLGVHSGELFNIYSRCIDNGLVVSGVFSHLYNAYDESISDVQLSILNESSAFLPNNIKRHIAASSCTFLPKKFGLDMVRTGIAAYGYSPLSKPIMKVKSSIINVKSVARGKAISYGDFTASNAMRIALIRGGYADGIARKADISSSDRFVSINGKRCPIVGQVCMDMTMIDVTDVKFKNSDEVYFLDGAVNAYDIAAATNTSEYEVLTSFKGRVVKQYI